MPDGEEHCEVSVVAGDSPAVEYPDLIEASCAQICFEFAAIKSVMSSESIAMERSILGIQIDHTQVATGFE